MRRVRRGHRILDLEVPNMRKPCGVDGLPALRTRHPKSDAAIGRRRRSRAARPAPRTYAMQKRDAEILFAAGRMKFATTSQLSALFFGSRATCSRRLAKLVGLGLLNVFVPRPDGENFYGLSRRGFDWLMEHDEP